MHNTLVPLALLILRIEVHGTGSLVFVSYWNSRPNSPILLPIRIPVPIMIHCHIVVSVFHSSQPPIVIIACRIRVYIFPRRILLFTSYVISSLSANHPHHG